METATIKRELLEIIGEYIEISEDFDTSLSLKMDAGLNSFALMSLAAAIEEHFDISIPNAELQSFKNLDDIINYISACYGDCKN